MQDLLGAECDLAEILCVYSLHKNLSGLSEGIYRIGLICGGGGCERACKCAARRAGAASVEFDRNLCGSIFYAIFNHIYAILARLERKRCGFALDKHQAQNGAERGIDLALARSDASCHGLFEPGHHERLFGHQSLLHEERRQQ